MGITYFPTNFVYWENIQNHDKIKSLMMDKVLELDKYDRSEDSKLITNATTNFKDINNNFHEYFGDEILKDLVWKPLENLLSEINSTKNTPKILLDNSFIIDSWYTKYDKNGTFGMHYHYNNDIFITGKRYQRTFSIIYILNDKNETNTTLFTVPHGAPLSTMPKQQFRLNTADKKEIKEGTVLIFPSSLYHEVLPTKIPGRITIAFNIASHFINDDLNPNL